MEQRDGQLITKEQGKIGIGTFGIIAILEHIVFVVILALAIYTKPALVPIEPVTKVTFIPIERPKKKKPDIEYPTVTPRVRRIQPNEELPSIQSTNVRDYFDSPESTGGLPTLPRTRASIQDPDRLSLGGSSPRGRHRRPDWQDEPESTVRAKPLVVKDGYHGRSDRKGLPDGEARKRPSGERGKDFTGPLAPGRLSEVKTNRITKGENNNIEILGQVVASGRTVEGGLKSLQAKGSHGGIVKLSFKVRPNGTVFDVQPKPGTTVGDTRLKRKAEQYVMRIRFSQLPKNVRQVVQSGEINIKFTVKAK